MIKFILVQVSTALPPPPPPPPPAHPQQNRQGKTRLSKWYAPYDDDEKERYCAVAADQSTPLPPFSSRLSPLTTWPRTVPGRQGHLPTIRRSLLLCLRRFQRQ
nr:AP-2 complex subunit sigma [Cryptococcus tetragattii IND107]